MANKANLLVRGVSKAMDLIVVFAIIDTLPRLGLVAGAFYILVSDGLMGGRSFGKKLTGLQVIHGKNGKPCDIKGSMLRNATLALAVVLMKIPLLGWLLFLAIAALEAVTLIGSSEGKRFGDEIASTEVTEASTKEYRGRQDSV